MIVVYSTNRRRRQRIVALCSLSVFIAIVDAKMSSPSLPTVSAFADGSKIGIKSLRLRGGSSGGGGGGESSVGDIDDDELDDYIDFLLAAAEDKVTEDDNPLFKHFRELAEETDAAPLEEEETNVEEAPEVVITTSSAAESTPEDTMDAIMQNSSAPIEETTVESRDPVISQETTQGIEEEDLEPLVEDVEDEAQLDEMIETLVATVEDDVDGSSAEEFVTSSTTTSSEILELEVDEDLEEVSSAEDMVDNIIEEVGEELIAEASVIEDSPFEEVIEVEAITQDKITTAPDPPLEKESDEIGSDVAEISLHEEVFVEQEAEEATPSGRIETSTGLEDQPEMHQERLVEEVPTEQSIELTLGEHAIPEVDIAEEAAAVEQETEIMMEPSVEEPPEFFLGPSAVEESPSLVEEAITENERAPNVEVGPIEELETKDEPVVRAHLHDLRYITRTASDLTETVTEEVTVPPSMLDSSTNVWGKVTARLLGINAEAGSTSSTLGGYAKSWGKWTALLMGIKDGSDTQQSTDRKKDYDRIYVKYFTDYVPDPAVYGYPDDKQLEVAPELQSVDTGNSGGIFSKPKERVLAFWGALGKLANQERGKPVAFFSRDTQTKQDQPEEDVGSISPSEGVTAALEDEDAHFVESSEEVYGQEKPSEITTLIGNGISESEDMEDDASHFLNDGLSPSDNLSTGDDSSFAVSSPEETPLGSNGEDVEEQFKNDADVQLGFEEAAPEAGSPDFVLDQFREDASSDAAEVEGSSSGQVEIDMTEPGSIDCDSSSGATENAVDSLIEDTEDELTDDGIIVDEVENIFDEYDGYESDNIQEDFEVLESEDAEEDFEAIESEESHSSIYNDPVVDVQTLETESLNFFYKFLVVRGLEGWLMTVVLLVEWFRVYLFSPFVDSCKWLSSKDYKSSSLDSLRNDLLAHLRGGSEGSDDSLSADEDGGSSDASSQDNADSSVNIEDINRSDTPLRTPIPRSRPNPFYRHLFGYGHLGHVLVMECILMHEWVDTYLPALGVAFTWAAQQMFPSMRGSRGLVDEPLSQTTGFVGADGSAVRGAKKKTSQTRKEDQKALTQLKQVGDVTQAKYRFLSEGFMKRYGIGQFADEIATGVKLELDKPRPRASKTSKKQVEDEPESDAEWIVSALTQDAKDDKYISTAEAASKNSGPTLTVGFEIGGSSRSRRRKRSAISDVARLISVTEKKKLSGPRVSDREAGVMGRIRAAGANSLVGRNLLGAYPGDAPAPGEAANPSGLFDLAEKYGYGEWSDMEEGLFHEPRSRKRRSRQTVEGMNDFIDAPKKTKKRRRSTSHLELGFDLGGMPSSATKSTVVKAADRKSAGRSSDVAVKKIRSKRETRANQGETKTVAQAGLDTFGKSAEGRGLDRRKKKSELTDVTKVPMARIREVKSEPGTNSVVKAGLQHMKESKKIKEDEKSK